MQQWEQATPRADGQAGPSCPLCRASWVHDPARMIRVLHEGLEAWAVQTYLEWLYTRDIRISDAIGRDTDAFNLALLQCWKVSTIMQDTTFRDALILAFFTEAQKLFWSQSIEWAFDKDEKHMEDIRDFIVEVFIMSMEPGWFKAHSDKWPKAFVQALADKSLERALAGGKDFDGLKAKYIGTTEEDSEPIEDIEEAVHDHADENDEEPDDAFYGEDTSRKRRRDKQLWKQNKRPGSFQKAELQAMRSVLEVDENVPKRKKKGSTDVIDITAGRNLQYSVGRGTSSDPVFSRQRSNATLLNYEDVGSGGNVRRRLRRSFELAEMSSARAVRSTGLSKNDRPSWNFSTATVSGGDRSHPRNLTYSRNDRLHSGQGVGRYPECMLLQASSII